MALNHFTQPAPSAGLEAYWRRHGVHRAREHAPVATITTGWPGLDRLLPGGGYPRAALTEWLIDAPGCGEFTLLAAALARRLRAAPGARLGLISPPWALNAPALAAAGIDAARAPIVRCASDAERVWCVEQMARCAAGVGCVLWSDTLTPAAMRRLQLVAEQAGAPVFVYRRQQCAEHSTPAALRLALGVVDGRQRLEIIKCRGPAGGCWFGLAVGRDAPWQRPTEAPALPRVADNENAGVEPPAALTPDRSEHVAGAALSPLAAR